LPKPAVPVKSSLNGTRLATRVQARRIHPGPAHEQRELLRWVADLYYLQQQGQAEIASLLGVSVSKVSRLLAEARRQGIVTIHVADSRAGESELERTLAGLFGLRAVYVAPARVAGGAAASRVAALMAARVLPQLLPREGAIGLSGGYTLAQVADALEPFGASDLTIVPLQGNWFEGGPHLHNDQIVRDAATRLGARGLSLPAPMLVERADTREALLHDRSIRGVTDRWAELRAAVVGIGSPPGAAAEYASVMAQLPAETQAELRRQGVAGDLCAHMFDLDGHFIEHEASRRTLSIPVDQLRGVPCVIAVAGGLNKAASLLGATRTGVPHVLITDQLAAEHLLRLAQSERSLASAALPGSRARARPGP
jgi:DNA-binding transcriptional regulator LsrR (DeoR family)